jgi:CO dehydrogenase maturation factor
VPLAVIGNKVHGEDDVEFLREHVGGALLTWVGNAPAMRAMEQGRPFGLHDLGHDARSALALMHRTLDAQVKDWPAFTRQAVEFHLKNARAWANAATGQDLATQVDPEFVMGPLPIDVTDPG